jgi:hypothetical protein
MGRLTGMVPTAIQAMALATRAVMVTDTALFRYRHYHTTNDTPDKLDYERMARVVTGCTEIIRSLR